MRLPSFSLLLVAFAIRGERPHRSHEVSEPEAAVPVVAGEPEPALAD